MLHGAVWPPRGWLLMSWAAKFFFIIIKVEKGQNFFLFFIDVKLVFVRLAHHFDTFFIFDF